MPYYYSAADITVSISSKDSFPNCMIEAMACRSPVVMGDIPSIREWVENGVNGFLVPPEDPEKLAEKIIEVFNYSTDKLKMVTNKAYFKVLNEANLRTNKNLIKELVSSIATNKS
jgi:glycosyltransferase involved in cell wall biosynthesis